MIRRHHIRCRSRYSATSLWMIAVNTIAPLGDENRVRRAVRERP
jgi:hypothetical protein